MSNRIVTIVVSIPDEISGDTEASSYVIETVSDMLTPFGDAEDQAGAYYSVSDSDPYETITSAVVFMDNGKFDLARAALDKFIPKSTD